MNHARLQESTDGQGVDGLSFDHLPTLVLAVEADGIVSYCNRRCEELLGVSSDDVVGCKFEEWVNPLDLKLLPADLRETVGWSQREDHPLEFHMRYGGPKNAADADGRDGEADGAESNGDGDGRRHHLGQRAEHDGGERSQMRRQANSAGNRTWRLFALDATDLGHGRLLLALHPIGPRGRWSVPRKLLLEAVEAADSSITIADCRVDDMPLVYVNRGFCKMSGYGEQEILGRNCRFLQFRPDGTRDEDQPGLAELRDALETGDFANAVLRNYTKDGRLFHNDLYLTPVRSRGDVVAFIGVQNNVSGRIHAAEQLAQREHTIRSFFDAAPMMMGVLELRGGRDEEASEVAADKVDPDAWLASRHVMLNQPATEFFGLEKGQTNDLPLSGLKMRDDCLRTWAENLAATMGDGRRRQFRCELRGAGDAEGDAPRQVRVTVNVIDPGDHEPPRASYIAEDVSEAYRTESERRLLAAAVENSDLSVLITDVDLDEPGPRILYVNPAFTRTTGYAPDEVIGKTPRILQGPLTDRTVLNRVREALGNEERFVGETINYHKDGAPYNIRWSIAPIRDGDGKLTHWVASQEDVTHRRQLEREVLDIQQSEQKRIARDLHDSVAQQLNALSLYAQTIRHELSDAAEGQGLEPEQAAECFGQLGRVVELAAEAAANARAISHALLPVDLTRTGLMLALQRLASQAVEIYGIECEFDCADPILLQSHEAATHLHRIAQEALNNAVRHGKAGRVHISLHRSEDPSRPEETFLTILDDGVGIASPAPTAGVGLSTMRYRAEIVGGSLTIACGNGGGDRPGTAISVKFVRDLSAEPPDEDAAGSPLPATD